MYLAKGGCIVQWTNFGKTQFTFLPPKCGSNYHVFVHYGILNGTHFEIINFNMFVVKLIDMENM
jgi:hypothetical protein